MGWSPLWSQFCLELAFGVLIAMAFVPRAPVGRFFYRLMGTTAVVPILAATFMPPLSGSVPWTDPPVVAAGIALLAYPVYSGGMRGRAWAIGLAVAIVATAAGLVLEVQRVALLAGGASWVQRAVASTGALATGAVAGSVGLAMVLGHWYLTIPNLAVAHLVRLNRVCVVAMLVSLLFLSLSCWLFAAALAEGSPPLMSPFGLFYLATRATVGLLMPLLFAWMTAQSLRFQNTRSATGILYASTVLVLIGSAASIALQDSYGVPL